MITLGILEVGVISLLFYYIIRHNSQKKIQYIELSAEEYNQILPYLNNASQINDNLVPPPYQNNELNDTASQDNGNQNNTELQPPEYSITNSSSNAISNANRDINSNDFVV